MEWKQDDWIKHASFGIGQVAEDRGDRLDIDFVGAGKKTLLKSTDLKPAAPPSPDFKFPRHKVNRGTPGFKVERPPRRPPLEFDHLVSCFKGYFPEGFEGSGFHDTEREYKKKAVSVMKEKLGKGAFGSLLQDRRYSEVCEIAKHVMQSTNLVFRIEKAKFADGSEIKSNQERFANALFELLHGSGDMEERFTRFCEVLAEMDADKWTVATYFQFLASDGKWMFMKPSIMKPMADSLKISLNYKAEPNWLTYSKLQELADRVELELRNRGLNPHSRIDVQGFIWASIEIEKGKY